MFNIRDICPIDEKLSVETNCVATALYTLGVIELEEFKKFTEITKRDTISTSPLAVKNKIKKKLTELYSSNKIKLSDSLDNNIDIDSVNFEYIKVPSIDSLIYFIKHIMQNNDAIYLSLKMGKYDYHAFVIYKVNNKTIDIYDNNILISKNMNITYLDESIFLSLDASVNNYKILLGLLENRENVNITDISRSDLLLIQPI